MVDFNAEEKRQEAERLAFKEGYEQGMQEFLATVERPCMSKDVGAPGSLMRRANDLGRELARLRQEARQRTPFSSREMEE